jgi:hypothetical protein
MYLRFQGVHVKFWHHVLRCGRLSTEDGAGGFLRLEAELKSTGETPIEQETGWCRHVSRPLLKYIFVRFAQSKGVRNPEGAWCSFFAKATEIFSNDNDLVQTENIPGITNPVLTESPPEGGTKVYPAKANSLRCVLLGPLLDMREALAIHLDVGAHAELLFPGPEPTPTVDARELITPTQCLTSELRKERGESSDLAEIRSDPPHASGEEHVDVLAMQQFLPIT